MYTCGRLGASTAQHRTRLEALRYGTIMSARTNKAVEPLSATDTARGASAARFLPPRPPLTQLKAGLSLGSLKATHTAQARHTQESCVAKGRARRQGRSRRGATNLVAVDGEHGERIPGKSAGA